MNYLNNEFEDLVTHFWNSEKEVSQEQTESLNTYPTTNNHTMGNKTIEISKYFVNDESNNTKTTCASFKVDYSSESVIMSNSSSSLVVEAFKKPKIFNIKKYVKYEEIIKEFCSDDEEDKKDKTNKKLEILKNKKVKYIKYNIKKLNNVEKLEKLKILSKVVRRYRRKLKNLKKNLILILIKYSQSI